MKILVATQTIPSGVGITADFVAFQEVALSEVPLEALSSFAQVYRRQPAYPIPIGCPICEDLLLPYEETASQAAFIPTGSQLVTLDIVHVRQENKVFPPKKPLSTVIAAEQRIDIRVVPRNEAQGKLAEMKNHVLQVFAQHDFKNSGELVLESVPIHQIQRQPLADSTGAVKDSIVLLLDKNEAAKLSAAAKRGQIRVLVCQDRKDTPQKVEVEDIFEVAEQSPALTVPVLLEQPLPPDTPLALRQIPPAPAILEEDVPIAAPLPVDIFDTMLPSVPDPSKSSAMEFLQNLDPQAESQMSFVTPELGGGEKILIRNDVSINMPSQSLSSGQPVEQSPALTKIVPAPEPQHKSSVHPLGEPGIGIPRVSQSIQFLPPGDASSARRERSREMERRPEIDNIPSLIPLVIPTPPTQSEKTGTSGYSPFDRRLEHRIYTIQPDDDWDENACRLPAPPPLLKVSDTGT